MFAVTVKADKQFVSFEELGRAKGPVTLHVVAKTTEPTGLEMGYHTDRTTWHWMIKNAAGDFVYTYLYVTHDQYAAMDLNSRGIVLNHEECDLEISIDASGAWAVTGIKSIVHAVNLGKSLEEVEADEKALSELIGTTVAVYTAENDQPRDGMEFQVKTWMTERELVEKEGFHYLRLVCPDHCWPPAEVIDAFIEFAKDLEEDAWLHFHCQAGSGRTGAFMTIYEMMQKPDTSVEEILQHQAETGSGNLVDRAKPEKSPAQKERCVLARAVYLYIRENSESGYSVKWSEWLEAHSRTVTMQIGEALEGEGFSSDPLIVSDSLEAVAGGQATVLADDIVYFITVQ